MPWVFERMTPKDTGGTVKLSPAKKENNPAQSKEDKNGYQKLPHCVPSWYNDSTDYRL